VDYLVVCAVALLAAALTFFSGFGLGTLLLPAFALFFPVELAVAGTAVVHFANNLFKGGLVGRHAHWPTVAVFGGPAALAAFAGAGLLHRLAARPPLARFALLGVAREVTPVKAVIAALMAAFAVLDLVPALGRVRIGRRWLPLGGLLSGFFGGLSGHQGALRAAFLTKGDLDPRAFVATGTVIAIAVDVVRLLTYGASLAGGPVGGALAGQGGWTLVAAATAAAFAGSLAGARLLPKVTMRGIRAVVGALLLLLAAALGTGLV
jgi:hypothetical protein